MLNVAIALAAALLLSALLHFERARDTRGVLPVKTALSCLFILTAAVQPHPLQRYDVFVLIGLAFCLGGDVFLALPGERAFMPGLVCFLAGHLAYCAGFFQAGSLNEWVWIGAAFCVVLGGVIYRRPLPHLGTMKLAVLLYVIVISAMVLGAIAVAGSRQLPPAGRALALSGALFFYFSDIFVARDRFLEKQFFNRLVGLPMYYLGQFMLAFSVGLIGG